MPIFPVNVSSEDIFEHWSFIFGEQDVIIVFGILKVFAQKLADHNLASIGASQIDKNGQEGNNPCPVKNRLVMLPVNKLDQWFDISLPVDVFSELIALEDKVEKLNDIG